MFTAVVFAAMLQTAAINGLRDDFMSCLDAQVEAAKSQKMAGDGFEAFARSNCQAKADALKAALVAFDVKNKVPRQQASDDAKLQIDDFVSGSAAVYKRKSGSN